MKKTLKFIALVIAAGFPVAAFAEFVGAPVAASAVTEIAVLAFALAVGGLILMKDYGPSLPELKVETMVRRSKAYGIRRRDTSRLAA